MRIVVISDLHSNFDALSALPEWGDELWVLGDLVDYGPQPNEVIDLIRSRSKIVMRGNHDHAVGFAEDPGCTPRYRGMALETQHFTMTSIEPSAAAYLRTLPLERIVERDGKRFFLCHATPSDPLTLCTVIAQNIPNSGRRKWKRFMPIVSSSAIRILRSFGKRVLQRS